MIRERDGRGFSQGRFRKILEQADAYEVGKERVERIARREKAVVTTLLSYFFEAVQKRDIAVIAPLTIGRSAGLFNLKGSYVSEPFYYRTDISNIDGSTNHWRVKESLADEGKTRQEIICYKDDSLDERLLYIERTGHYDADSGNHTTLGAFIEVVEPEGGSARMSLDIESSGLVVKMMAKDFSFGGSRAVDADLEGRFAKKKGDLVDSSCFVDIRTPDGRR